MQTRRRKAQRHPRRHCNKVDLSKPTVELTPEEHRAAKEVLDSHFAEDREEFETKESGSWATMLVTVEQFNKQKNEKG